MEVKKLPNNWIKVPLYKLCDMKSGEGITALFIADNGKYPCFGGNGLRGYTNRSTHKGEYPLIGRQGALCGNVVFASGEFFASEHAVVVTAKKNVSPKWLAYVLERMNLNQYSESSAQPGLSVSKLLLLEANSPCLYEEQQAIATALSDVDALISSLEKLIAKKRDIKQATMQQLLTGKKRLPGFEVKKGYKKTELGEIPEDWELKKLNFICDVRDGTHESPRFFEKGVPLITSKNIVNGALDFTDVSYIEEDVAREINKRSKVDKGDILMSMIGTIGNCVLVNIEANFCIKNIALFKPQRIRGNYFIQLLNSNFYQTYFNKKLDGGIQKFISLGTMRDLDVLVPTSDEQSAIAIILSDFDEEIYFLENKLNKTQLLKQGMMQELLTGRIRLI